MVQKFILTPHHLHPPNHQIASGIEATFFFSLSTDLSHLLHCPLNFPPEIYARTYFNKGLLDIPGQYFLFRLFSVQVLLLEKEQQHLDKTQNWRRKIDPLVFWVSSAEDKLNTQFAIAPDLDTVKKQKAELEVHRNKY